MRECERISRALSLYRELAAKDDGASLPDPGQPVEPGEHYYGVPRLIHLLSLVGDLPPEAALPGSDSYEGELVAAVKRFQLRHGLEPDGVIGPTTLEQLNTPLAVRVRQLELAADQWRHLPCGASDPAIVVNLPEFRLRAYGAASDAGDDPELEMKVIVGHAPDRESPTLASHLEAVIFRPYWNVPASIQRSELLPEIKRGRISANSFELVTSEGKPAGNQSLKETVAGLSTGEFQLRQKPGPKNALGLVKFMFPNGFGIYMHDTSARSLFARERRDLSHGCIRVEKPVDLAEWVLAGQPEWSRRRIEAAMKGTETITVKVKRPIAIVIMYATAAVTKDGEVHFFKDIYGDETAFQEALQQEGNRQ